MTVPAIARVALDRREPASRRQFLKIGPAALLGLAGSQWMANGSAQARVFGVVLTNAPADYTLATLKAFADMGYRDVEGPLSQIVELRAMLTDVGLTPRSGFLMDRAFALPTDTVDLQKALAQAKSIPGLTQVAVGAICPPNCAPGTRVAPSPSQRNLDYIRAFADRMNVAGDLARQAGLTLAYHPFSWEFGRIDGGVPMDLLLERFDRDRVKLEIDPFWIAVAGHDPVALIRRRGKQVSAIHLRDMAKGTARSFTGDSSQLPPEALVAVGAGEMDIPAILRAANDVGVAYRLVEETSPGDRLANQRQAIRYLSGLGL